jgi:hypothetical protein
MAVPTQRLKQNQSLKYDGVMLFWRTVTQVFFREIRPRGAFNIPRDGPVIFVGAPHNNQVRLFTYYIGRSHLSPVSSSTLCCCHSKYIGKRTGRSSS